ncbi:S9 family peptidase [Sphingosinicella sp. CPCC 101087]|uniref:S9 family peptidase n=1 Tax=Sphingosinicella sp. CPCC 101087 TaxID=2497754 RepID=UPI00101D86AE|nr:S9 family peptidase [Sphingosinicella sp. CPCC 101087]
MRFRLILLLVGMVSIGPLPSFAQPQGGLELDQIYGAQAVELERAETTKWLGRGDHYTIVQPSATTPSGSDIVRIETASGVRDVLVAASDLRPDGAAAPLTIDDYQWSPDGRYLLVATNAQRFRRNRALADYWLLDLRSKALHRLGAGLEPSSMMHAEFSPDGRLVAYVYRNNLYVEPVAGGGPRPLTNDGSDLIVNGIGDAVYEEEFFLAKAFTWSPDSRRIAFWRFDTEGVGTFYMIRNTGGQYSEPVPLQYPKPGTTLSAVRIGTVAVADGRTTWFRLEGDPRQNYVPRMSWADRPDEVIIQYMNRLQNRNEVLMGDAETGATRRVFLDEDATAWVEANDDPVWLDGGKAFTWLSERDGWRHFYIVSRDGQRLDLRTPGEFDVVSVESVDEESGWVYFIASPDDPTRRYLFRAPLKGDARIERVTPQGLPGTHAYAIAPGARWAFHSFSTFHEPPRTGVVSLPAHAATRGIVDNEDMRALLAATPRQETEFFRIDIGGGVRLDAWMIRPADFDPSKKYPLLLHVYSEPAGQTVADRWGGDRTLWHMMLAQRGYLVASVDSRGANSPRGRDWRKSIYRQVGILASADQAAALRRMMADRPYIDPERVGIWGASGGGAMTLNALFRYPDLYRTGIAIASPANQLLYNAIYQERYMGLPDENAEGYRDGSPINFAGNLRGNLLIIHGTGDDNVHYQNLEQLADRLIAENKQFSMMAYPDRTHSISEGPNTRLHMFTMMTDYLGEHLPPGGR